MNTGPKELPIPPQVREDQKAIEIARVWAAGGKQHVSLATGLWTDPASWGIMLVDLAKMVADAYQQLDGHNVTETLTRIKAGFDAEWTVPTEKPTGQVLD